jgi:hypothetical protein
VGSKPRGTQLLGGLDDVGVGVSRLCPLQLPSVLAWVVRVSVLRAPIHRLWSSLYTCSAKRSSASDPVRLAFTGPVAVLVRAFGPACGDGVAVVQGTGNK